jgi:predicted phage terminase large subunit-like protein
LRSPQEQAAWLASLTDSEVAALAYEWRFWARPNQIVPSDDGWFIWLAKPGRGWGKTRAGSEFIRERVESGKAKYIALVNDTARDTRAIMVEGQDGIIAKSPPWCKPVYEPGKSRLKWPKTGGPWAGAEAYLYSAEAPEILRGPQHDTAWCDELAKWQNLRKVDKEGGTAWDNLLLGMRIGDPRVAVTTTPRAVPLIRDLIKNPKVRVVDGSTFENSANLSQVFYDNVIAPLEKTRLGRQEVYGHLLEDTEGALWTRQMIDAALAPRHVPPMKRVVVAIDPAVSSTEQSDETGIVVAGLGIDDHGYVLEDASGKYSPDGWARRAVGLYLKHQADKIVAEVNNGGDLVGYTLRSVGQHVPFKALHASRGKRTRAEPVSILYEQGKIHHTRAFPEMEDQLCTWDTNGGENSPDRLDALVWALTELMLERTQAVASITVDNAWQRSKW